MATKKKTVIDVKYLLLLYKDLLENLFHDFPSMGKIEDYRALKLKDGPGKWKIAYFINEKFRQEYRDDFMLFSFAGLPLFEERPPAMQALGEFIQIKVDWMTYFALQDNMRELVQVQEWMRINQVIMYVCKPRYFHWETSQDGKYVLSSIRCILIHNPSDISQSLFLYPNDFHRET